MHNGANGRVAFETQRVDRRKGDAGVFYMRPHPPPRLNPFLCLSFIPWRLIQRPTWHSSTSEPRVYELKQRLFIWCWTNVWPYNCAEICSNVIIVFELLCAWISWGSADLGAQAIWRPTTTGVELSCVRKTYKVKAKRINTKLFSHLLVTLLPKVLFYCFVSEFKEQV